MTHSTKLLMAALALHATYTSLLRCSALLMARMTLESASETNEFILQMTFQNKIK